jgi:NTE family protein
MIAKTKRHGSDFASQKVKMADFALQNANRNKLKRKRRRSPSQLKYDNLVIEGGGVLGIAYLGALKELYTDKSIFKATGFAGASIGSIVATLLSVRTPIEQLENTILNLDLNNFKDRTCIFVDMVRVFRNYGFFKGDKLLSFLKDMLKAFTGDGNITFQQIFDIYNSKLIITAANISRGKVVYFSKDTHPHMPVALATRISCSVPYFFQAMKFDGDYYVDGGLLDNYPIAVFDTDKQSKKTVTLGLKLVSNTDLKLEKGAVLPITGLLSFTDNLMNTIMAQALRVHVLPGDWERTIRIYTGDLNFLKFDLTDEEKNFLVDEGKKAIKEYKKLKIIKVLKSERHLV